MEQFHDYRMVDDRSVVEQAHAIQTLAKEFENFGTVLPDKFMAGCIIATGLDKLYYFFKI